MSTDERHPQRPERPELDPYTRALFRLALLLLRRRISVAEFDDRKRLLDLQAP
jgi:hypothetical protein